MKRFVLAGGALAFVSILGAQSISLADPPDAGPGHFQRFGPGGRMHFSRSFHMGGPEQRARLGIVPIAISSELRTHLGAPADRGVLVDHVQPGGAAAKAGIAVGDVLTVVAGKPVTTREDVVEALDALGTQTIVNLMIVRSGTPLPLVATMPKADDAADAKGPGNGGDEADRAGDDGGFDFGFDDDMGPMGPGRFPFDLGADPKRLEALEKRLDALEKRLETH